ncbi:MAG: YjjW family glycine radical enzyme activase [Clostridia bacterium]|nr:YjjW family glycine radical enzyme activase [Clostridia bacterium]
MRMYLREEQEKMESKAVINKIIPFSNVDGPGNRYAIFFQGCNINCIYCHNPETIHVCNHCMACIEKCPGGALKREKDKVVFYEDLCIACDACIRTCRLSASPKAKLYTVEQLIEQIQSYKAFIRGITVSGGEPTLQKDFVVQLFRGVKPMGLTCFVDTNGFFSKETCQGLIEITDRFMIDIKSMDCLEVLCGTKNNQYVDNLKYLLKLDKVYEVRTVIVKDMDAEKTVKEVSKILKGYPNVIYKLIKVHILGLTEEQKQKMDGKIPEDKEVYQLVELAKSIGVNKVSCIL